MPIADQVSFTASQRRAIVALLVVGVGYAGWTWWANRTVVPDPQPESGIRASELADQIDLETADWQTLAILPGIGESKARAILRKRDERRARSPGERAFARPADLMMVDGIGAATVEKLRPYLYFPPPATQPVP
jgi:DNA uptake protein ComE-like DNA-binding protein